MNYRTILLPIAILIASLLHGQAGTLDPTYADNAEIRNLNFLPSSQEILTHSVTDSQNRTWVGGYSEFEGDRTTIISRLDEDGNFDTDFNESGFLVENVSVNNYEELRSMTIDNDHIIIAGVILEDGNLTPFLIKYNPDGSIDNTFGEDGLARPSLIMNVSDVTTDESGNIFVSGTSVDHNVVVFKLLPNGQPDFDFGFLGVATVDFPSTDQTVGLDLDEDGNIYLFGYGTLNGTTRGQITAFTSDGESNSSFTPNSRRSITWPNDKAFFVSGGYFDAAESSFYLSGRTEEDGGGQISTAMVKVGIDSEQDMSFGSDGWLEIDLGLGADDLSSSILEGPQGSYVAASVTEFPSGINSVVLYVDENG
ncbi:MAG: hypothetical protein AAGC47_14590, partial [Bacteroidota bacterium]